MDNMTATGSYRVLLSGGEGEIVEKKSRFIATIRKCETEEEAVAFIEEMKKKYWDARHNCSAFIIGSRGELTRCSDDGGASDAGSIDRIRYPQYCGGSDQIFWWHVTRHRWSGAGLYPGGEGGTGPLRDRHYAEGLRTGSDNRL